MCADGETSFQTESGLWAMAYEGEAWDRRIWTCLPVSKSGNALPYPITVDVGMYCFIYLVVLPVKTKKMNFPHYYFLQETSEKIAVKLCRLELNTKNKDRWSREIQIMKKCVNL